MQASEGPRVLCNFCDDEAFVIHEVGPMCTAHYLKYTNDRGSLCTSKDQSGSHKSEPSDETGKGQD